MTNPLDTPAKEFTVPRLLDSSVVSARNVDCRGSCHHRSAEECASNTHLVFPYRGLYLRHVGGEQTVADANHVLLLSVSENTLRELAPRNMICEGGMFAFNSFVNR